MKILNQLRNRLLVLNMTLFSVLLLSAFVIIFVITYRQIDTSIGEELNRISDFHDRPPFDNPPESFAGDAFFEGSLPGGEDGLPPVKPVKDFPKADIYLPDRSIAFTIITDDSGQVLNIRAFFDIASEFYPLALETVQNQNKNRGKFDLGGYVWAYHIRKYPGEIRYGFVDISSKQAVLDKMIITLIGSAAVTLIIIFAISYFLTQKSMSPVRDAFRRQKQFISDASHELKTPLAIISANTELIQKTTVNEQDSRWIDVIKNETANLINLTTDLLHLASLEGYEEIKVEKEKFLLSQLLESTLLSAEGLIFEKKRSLNYTVQPDISYKGVKQHIVQIINGLLDNAIKYSSTGGEIRVTLQNQGRWAVLEVANEGEGISSEDLPNIFDRFYRADKSRARRNNSYGLGLAIIKALVDEEGGSIQCSSLPGKETVFRVHLKTSV